MLRLTRRWLWNVVMLCGLSAFASAPSRCSAQGALSLDREGCASTWADGIERFVAIELGAAPEDRPPGALDISVQCDGDEVEIAASERGAASSRRQMDLSGTAEAVRGRVVALAIAGLVRELAVIARSGTQPAPEHTAEPIAPPPAPAPAVVGTTDLEHVVQLDLFLAGSTFTGGPGLLWGGGVRARALALAPLYAALDGQAATYGRDSELGSARLIAGSAGARIGWTHAWRRSAIGAGVGQRLGIARASASAAESGATDSSVAGLWAAPFVFIMADTALFERVRVGVDGELGAVLSPMRGRIEGGDDIVVAGAWLALSATLGIEL